MKPDFDHCTQVVEARAHIERALGGISTLHLGPLDYNVSQVCDDLLSAAEWIRLLLEEERAAP